MTDWRHHIVSDPTILAGKPVVRDTRLAVDFLLGLFASGWTEEQILHNDPALTHETLRGVFASPGLATAGSSRWRRAPAVERQVVSQALEERTA